MNSVNITKRVMVAAGKRFCPVVFSGNGRIKPDWVIVDGQETKVSGGSYYIDWTKDNKRERVSVGKDPANALARKLRKEAELKAESSGIALVPQSELDKRTRIDTAITSYLEEVGLTKKKKTLQAYTVALKYFRESCTKTYVEEIERMDLLKFSVFLRDRKGQSPRSVSNKFENVMTFLKSAGLQRVVRKGDWPTYVEEDVEIYEKEDLDKFFKACSKEEKLWFEFFLMTGLREQEVIYMTDRNVNLKTNVVLMRWSPDYKWTPKAYKEREIPIPDRLLDELKAYKPHLGTGNGLLFPTSSGKPKFDFLDTCKRVAKRANLDPDDWYLHKFRATFCTWHLWAGVDIRTVQDWMGHTDLESTLRYLKPARGQQVREKVNATFG